MSQYHHVTTSPCHLVTMSPFHHVTMPSCHVAERRISNGSGQHALAAIMTLPVRCPCAARAPGLGLNPTRDGNNHFLKPSRQQTFPSCGIPHHAAETMFAAFTFTSTFWSVPKRSLVAQCQGPVICLMGEHSKQLYRMMLRRVQSRPGRSGTVLNS